MKLRKSHLQSCRKKIEHCDLCQKLKSSIEEKGTLLANAMAGIPLSQPRKAFSPDSDGDEDVKIIKVVRGVNKPKKGLPESRPSGQQAMNCDEVRNNPKAVEQGTCTAVMPLDKTAVSCSLQHQEQKHLSNLQLINGPNGDIIPCNQVLQPHLEVLCGALKALNTVIQLVKSSQLEMHAIPLLEQALADMKITALNRLDGQIGPTPLPLVNTSIVMEYCESDISSAENQWIPLQSPPPPSAPPPPTPQAPPPPPLSTSLLPLSAPGSAVTVWQSPLPSTTPAFKAKFNANPVVEIYGDVTDDFDFDQDSLLLDFVEELLG